MKLSEVRGIMVERRASLLEFIQTHGEVSTEALFTLFPDKTPKTIRRDLTYLEQAGAILRSHGRARVNKQFLAQPEPYYSERESENVSAKNALAVAAAPLLRDRRAIFLDSGTTMMALAQLLPDNNLTVVTAAPNIALYIASKKPSCSVLLTGGNLSPKTLSCSGYGSAEIIRLINIDLAFMATSAFSSHAGFTVGEHFEGELKRAVINKAEKVVMLMDHSKNRKSMPFTFARPQDIDTLVCDRLDGETEDLLKSKGVQIVHCARG